MSPGEGLLLVNKPAGLTSFSALRGLKKNLQTKKVGHTGTLDRFAQGLLVVLTGSYTRLNPYIVDLDKTYQAVFEMGRETRTLDPEGETFRTCALPDEKTLHQKRELFVGSILQSPPAFSAIHLEGERAYRRALRGEALEMPQRPVEIHEFSLLDWKPPLLSVRVRCGKGTYIRSLARDFGAACGSCASLASLHRTAVGPFSVEEAFPAQGELPADAFRRGEEALRKLFARRLLTVRDAHLEDIRKGRELSPGFFRKAPVDFGSYLVFSEGEKLAALIEFSQTGLRYRFVAAGEG